MLIVGTYSGGDLLQQHLGGTPTRSETLPDDLTPYKVIWYVHYATLLSNEDRARLVAFVQGGGGLYLSGEGSCCEGTNLSIKAIIAAVVENSTNIQVGGLGNVDPLVNYWINPGTEIASLPNSLGPVAPWTTTSAGGMLNVLPQNQFITSDVFNTIGATTVAAAWDGPALVGDHGRLVVMMDANWVFPAFFTSGSYAVLGNITRFLLNAPEPNQAPTATILSVDTRQEGIPLLVSSEGSSDPDGDALTYAWDLDNDGAYDDGTGFSTIWVFEDNGSYTFHLRVTDAKGASATASKTIVITNMDPRMTFTVPAAVSEGAAIALSASSFLDVTTDEPTLQVTYSCDGGTTFGNTPSCPGVDGPATVNVVGRITDKDGGSTSYPKTVTVTNAAPVITGLTLPIVPVAIGAPVSLAATFSDAWATDGHTASIDWDDAATTNATLGASPNGGSVSASHTYSTPGVYAVTLTVKDDAGAEDTELHQYVVVYDPSSGFVTGGGWIAYGSTSCPVLCGGATGRGDFGFVSKYKKGANVPSGDTRFEFHAATLAFASVEYEWLVVAGKRAQFRGRGTINGGGNYDFMLTAVDDATDGFRIKIWNASTNEIVFDNKMGSSDNSSDATLLNKVSGNGSIVIHAK
jgi:PKD repeat protein